MVAKLNRAVFAASRAYLIINWMPIVHETMLK